MKTKLLGMALAVGASLFAANASAAILHTSWQSATTGVKGTGAGGDTQLTFDLFDPALGTLHNVEFQLGADAWATYSYTDISGSTNNFLFAADVTVRVDDPTSPGNFLVQTIPGLIDDPRSVGPNGTYQVGGFPDPLLGLTGSANSGVVTYQGITLTPALAALFTGPGTINLLTGGNIAFNFNGTNDATTSVISRYDATLQVRYSYDDGRQQTVPEIDAIAGTGALTLLGGALALAGERRRRRA